MSWSTLISAAELNNADRADWLLIDVRHALTDLGAGRNAWETACIPGAQFLDIREDLSDLSKRHGGRHPLPGENTMRRLFSSLGIRRERQVVVYDASYGGFAGRLWWMLRYMGHDAVAVLDGGWQQWLAAKGQTMPGHRETQPRCRFQGTIRHDWLVCAPAVLQQKLLVDSREPERYRGEYEPLDPVAGHIDTAANRFWMENIHPDTGCFYPPAVLKQQLLELFDGTEPERVSWYCGSGVTACHNLLAQCHAGLGMGRLYAGSWSEWCLLKPQEFPARF